MHETSKATMRRLHDSRFATRYFVGAGMDVGAGPDSLEQYVQQFPLMKSCYAWDLKDGDAQFLEGVADGSLDFVHSSHCLEHLNDPYLALENWLRVLRPGGHMIVLVPDEDLYEQGEFPSTYNPDHKWTFTLHKPSSWSPRSVNVFDLLSSVSDAARILKVELLDATWRRLDERFDQTLTPVGESAIEFVLRKWRPDEARSLGEG